MQKLSFKATEYGFYRLSPAISLAGDVFLSEGLPARQPEVKLCVSHADLACMDETTGFDTVSVFDTLIRLTLTRGALSTRTFSKSL